MKKILISLIVAFVTAYVGATAFMYFNQRGFIFVPSGNLETPADKGLENVSAGIATMSDGTDITIWTADPSDPEKPTVLYFHGNSGTLSRRWQRFKIIVDSGYGLYAPTHRGYAGAGGTPSETALISDALEHFDRLAEAGKDIILHGESLGTGIATAVAAERPEAELLVLEAPYTALLDMASQSYPWLPVGLLMKDPMLTRERIGNVTAPVLIVHGTEDDVIPVEHGKRLFEFATDPRKLIILEGEDHGSLWKSGLWDAVEEMRNGDVPEASQN